MDTILGIDPGFGRVGWGLVEKEGNSLRCREYGCITTSPVLSFIERLHHIHSVLTELITRVQPTLMGVEELFFAKNTKTAIDVGQARGGILLTGKLLHIPVVEYTPLQVKQAVTGYGQAEKIQVAKMVTRILTLKSVPTPDDAADALAVAICASTYSPTLTHHPLYAV